MLRLSKLAQDRATDAVLGLLDGGRILVFGASGRQIAELHFSDPAFEPTKEGKAKARAIAPDEGADGNDRAAHFQAVTKAGEVVLEGDVGTELRLDQGFIPKGSRVSVERFVYTAELGSAI